MPMPRLVPTMTNGVISKWLVEEGDYLEVADLVCEIDVENLTSELPAATCATPLPPCAPSAVTFLGPACFSATRE